MAAMAATSWVGDDSISQDVQKTKPYKHTKFHALRKKCLFFLFFFGMSSGLLTESLFFVFQCQNPLKFSSGKTKCLLCLCKLEQGQ